MMMNRGYANIVGQAINNSSAFELVYNFGEVSNL
jgi:hypothetical protein